MDKDLVQIDQPMNTGAGSAAVQAPNRLPLISVVIPCFNQGHYVHEAIESVLAQTYDNYEILVVDDGSTDRTFEIVSQYPSVGCIRQRNRGLSAARNRGIHETTGEYVVCLDADDRLLPRHFEIGLDAFRSHPEAGWVCGDFQFLGVDPTWRHVHRCESSPDTFGSLLRAQGIGVIHSVMFRRQCLVKIGGFDESVRSCEDWELYLRLIKQSPLHCHHQLVAEYRVTDHQMSRRWYVMLKWNFRVMRSQWQFVRGNRLYEEAYAEGIGRSRARYGERALWQMVANARSGQWGQVFPAFWVLLRCYPAGLLGLVKVKAYKLGFMRKKSCP